MVIDVICVTVHVLLVLVRVPASEDQVTGAAEVRNVCGSVRRDQHCGTHHTERVCVCVCGLQQLTWLHTRFHGNLSHVFLEAFQLFLLFFILSFDLSEI